MSHQKYLRRAIELAKEGMLNEHGGPFGAVVVRDGEVIAEAYNTVTSTNDPTAHGEVNAIRLACKKLQSFQLDNCILYTSCEPCPMCLGAIYWARPKAVYYAAKHSDAAKVGFDDSFIYQELDKAPEDRNIPMHQLLETEGWEPFALWAEKEDRREY